MRDVTAQPFETLLLFHGGIVTGFLYLLIRVMRTRLQRRNLTHLFDALFVLTAGVVFTGYLYLANRGTVRAFLLFGYGFGFVLTYLLFASGFSAISQKIRKK